MDRKGAKTTGFADNAASLDREMTTYWNKRSETYSNSVKDELRDFHLEAWRGALEAFLSTGNAAKTAGLKVLDLGCGPGFFEIALSELGCSIDAVDNSEEMLNRARENVAAKGNQELVDFHLCDVAKLPFPSSSYDAIVSRNVTWLLRDPIAAYAEWQRVLKPGGKLLVFDANWYFYLVDGSINEKRIEHQSDTSILAWSENSFATDAQERQCESMALRLPLTYERRPAWDISVLPTLGFRDVRADENFSRLVWGEGEISFYATSPLFAVEAIKTDPADA